jgi:hypothetical protein
VLAAKPAGPGHNNTQDIPTRPVPLFAMLGDALEATPEPYLEIDAVPDYGRRETPPVVSPIVSPIGSPGFLPIFEPRPIIHLPSPAGFKKKAEKPADDEVRDADGRDKDARGVEAREVEGRDEQRREAKAPQSRAVAAEAARGEAEAAEAEVLERERKPRRAIPVAGKVDLSPEDPHSLLSNYPPVSPVQRAINRFVTRIAVLAALGGGLYLARPYIVQRIPTWPWVFEHAVRPVDKWLRHLPMRFAPSRIAPSASTTVR